jgi:hypothetical protein
LCTSRSMTPEPKRLSACALLCAMGHHEQMARISGEDSRRSCRYLP